MPPVRTVMQNLIAALKVRRQEEFVDYTDPEGMDATGGGAGLLELPRPTKFTQGPTPVPRPQPNTTTRHEQPEFEILTNKIIRDGIPVLKDGIPVKGEIKNGAKAIADALEHMLDPTYIKVDEIFKINTAHVLLSAYISSDDMDVKTKALNLLIKLTKDNDIDVTAESCKKLLYLIQGGHCEEAHLDTAVKSLSKAKDTLDERDHAELIQDINDLLARG